jgi:EpsI family protein
MPPVDYFSSHQAAHASKLSLLYPCGILGILYCFLCGPLLPGLLADWHTENYAYGALVPLIAGYLIWQKSDALEMSPLKPTFLGCIPLVISVTMFLLGQLAADVFIMRTALVLALAALTQVIFGNHYLFRLAFPLLYLFLMVPLPYTFVSTLTHALMFSDAILAVNIVGALGIPVYLDANVLYLPNITLIIADVCSGISSVLALFVLGAVYAYVLPVSPGCKIILVLSAVPLAAAANLFRIVVTVVLAYHYGMAALDSYFHKIHGTFNFVLAVCFLAGLGELLRRISPRAQAKSARRCDVNLAALETGKLWGPTVASSLILCAAIVLSGGFKKSAATESWIQLDKLPLMLTGYVAQDVAAWDHYDDPKAKSKLSRIYSDSADGPIELFIGSQGTGVDSARLQSPKLIFPDGWSYHWIRPMSKRMHDSQPLEANWILTQQGKSRKLILYWYQSGDWSFTGEMAYRIALLRARALGLSGDLLVARIATALPESETVEEAQERIARFVMLLWPELRAISNPYIQEVNR